MNEWVEVNIPFGPVYDETIPEPKLDHNLLVKRYSGTVPKISEHQMKSYKSFMWSVIERVLRDMPNLTFEERINTTLEEIRKSKDPDIVAALKYVEDERKYQEWLKDQPEYIEWNSMWERRCLDSISKRELNRPGTLLDVEGLGKVMMGHCNIRGNFNGDPDEYGIKNTRIVKRYKRVWSEDG